MPASAGQEQLLKRMQSVVEQHRSEVAVLEPGGEKLTYEQLASMVAWLQTALDRIEADRAAPIGLLLERSGSAYAAMWAAVARGRPYVPLNTSYPASRLREIIEQAGVGPVVVSRKTQPMALEIGVPAARLIVDDDAQLAEPVEPAAVWQPHCGGDIAYLLFTSGSTGKPKGVPISYDNLWAFAENLAATIPYRAGEVCSQVCELSFDFSVHEIYLALLSGSTLCPARTIDLFNPAAYVERNGITVWISVPSLARVVLANRRSADDRLESIRLSIFNGEALTSGLAADWQQAAPNTEIWNNYGPTECTVAVTAQRYRGEPDLEEADVVAIGTPLPGCRTAVDAGGAVVPTERVADGLAGELLLAGPQRFDGYLDPSLASPFVTDAGQTWYRTGDRVRWRDGRLFHLGRLDHQVKIGGHRIELLEIEHRLRQLLDREELAVIAHPRRHPTELILFVTSPIDGEVSAETSGLPAYMVPRRTMTVDSLPLSTHRKLDRDELHRLADEAA